MPILNGEYYCDDGGCLDCPSCKEYYAAKWASLTAFVRAHRDMGNVHEAAATIALRPHDLPSRLAEFCARESISVYVIGPMLKRVT